MLNQNNQCLRVVYVTTGYPSPQNPNLGIFIHRSIKAISNKIDAQVIHIRAWKPKRPFIEQRTWEGIPIVSLAIPHFPTYKFVKLNAWLMSKVGFASAKPYIQSSDLVHSTSLYPGGYIVYQWLKTLNKPHVTQAIGSDVYLFLENLFIGNIHWLSACDGISCNSNALHERLSIFASGHANARVIHRGVDTVMFTPKGTTKGPQVNSPPVRYLYLGGFQTWNPTKYDTVNCKGGHILLEAWRQAEMHLASSSLIIGGSGTDPSRLEGWRSSLAKPQNVHILPSLHPGEVPDFLRACDVVVLPSITEGLPNLANEAQACGRPVLGTNAGGIPETVAHGETGFIVERRNTRALAQGLVWFFENQDKIARMGEMGRLRMVKFFSWENYIEQTLALYQTSLAHHNSK
jgi:glycosyltransferase involved in cell wall biosynthesis